MSFPCPSCGANDWKQVKDHITRSYSQCGNCKHDVFTDKMEVASLDQAKELIETLTTDVLVLRAAYESALEGYELGKERDDAIILFASVKKTLRDLTNAEVILAKVAEMVILTKDTQQGCITLHLPEYGFHYQFKWGGYVFL